MQKTNLTIIFVVVLILLILFIRFLKKRKRRKELIRKTHKISERRKWKIAYFIGELLSDDENFTSEGLEKIKNLKKELAKFKSEMTRDLNEYRNSLKEATEEARKDIFFDPFDKIGLANEMYSLQGKILQIEVKYALYEFQMVIIFTALKNLCLALRNDPIFHKKTIEFIVDDISYLEKRKLSDIHFSELENKQVSYTESVIKKLSIAVISEDLLPRLKLLKSV